MSNRIWRVVFLASAMFNTVVGLSMMFDTTAVARSFGLEVHYDALYWPVLGWFVLMFGALYFIVSRNLDNVPIAIVGMVGKLGVAALMWLAYARGLATLPMAALTVGDIVFATLFAVFLLTRRPTVAEADVGTPCQARARC